MKKSCNVFMFAYSNRIRIVEYTLCWAWEDIVAKTKEDIDDSERLTERCCKIKNNVCWNRLKEQILRTVAMRYLAMNLQRLRYSALMTSTSLLDWNLLKHMLFRVECIISHNYVVLSIKDCLQRYKTISCSIKKYYLNSLFNNSWINSICAIFQINK